MRDYLSLGSAPCNEDCAQVGTDSYSEQARKECKAYINQIKRKYPDAQLSIKSFPHDFGNYYEVVIYYDDTSTLAFDIEKNLPQFWDQQAKTELY